MRAVTACVAGALLGAAMALPRKPDAPGVLSFQQALDFPAVAATPLPHRRKLPGLTTARPAAPSPDFGLQLRRHLQRKDYRLCIKYLQANAAPADVFF